MDAKFLRIVSLIAFEFLWSSWIEAGVNIETVHLCLIGGTLFSSKFRKYDDIIYNSS